MSTLNRTDPKPTTRDEASAGTSVQIVPLPVGLYLLALRCDGVAPLHVAGQTPLPAVHIGIGPGVQSGAVEFLGESNESGRWLVQPTDVLVAKIKDAAATLILTSLRAANGASYSISVQRLGSGTEPNAAAAAHDLVGENLQHHEDKTLPTLPLEIRMHIRGRGDLVFADTPWAGRVGTGLWIESFALRPLARFAAGDIEYRAITDLGQETAWISQEQMCGTKGMAVPLVAFAMRLHGDNPVGDYECEYSGYFHSGLTVGPLREGVLCRSSLPNDSLEGIQAQLVVRRPVAASAIEPPAAVNRGTRLSRRAGRP